MVSMWNPTSLLPQGHHMASNHPLYTERYAGPVHLSCRTSGPVGRDVSGRTEYPSPSAGAQQSFVPMPNHGQVRPFADFRRSTGPIPDNPSFFLVNEPRSTMDTIGHKEITYSRPEVLIYEQPAKEESRWEPFRPHRASKSGQLIVFFSDNEPNDEQPSSADDGKIARGGHPQHRNNLVDRLYHALDLTHRRVRVRMLRLSLERAFRLVVGETHRE
ncbi:hypothetical protein BDZ85DRAFT_268817 [Elsinoe ampelina]|uniref:Uncharacterized protein n=1 Tax=Elsinoe ampelina TaxID=302913 RepID=A0A6A6G119_9PEZI|nr:hypothetical protein BDZ85DRAFT_268817 [Elsinoe ampelina]